MKLLLSIVIFFISTTAFAQKKTVANDSSNVQVRNINVSAYLNDSAFKYDVDTVHVDSWWDKFWRWFWNAIGALFSNSATGNLLNTIIIILAIAAIVFFVWKVTGMNRMGMFSKNNEEGIAYDVANDDIHGIDFNTAIDNAIAKNNYRLAVRLLYLQTLKLLTDKNFIDWKINKTNAAYVSELSNHPQQNAFAQLTRFFDKTWYGEGKVDFEQFVQLKQSFTQFQQQVR